MSRVARLLMSAAIVCPLAVGQASAACWHGLSSCSACSTYQAWGVAAPPMVPVAFYPYPAPAPPAAWGAASYPQMAPAAPGGLLEDCEGFDEMAPIPDHAPLPTGQLLAAHIYQNLGKASRYHGMPVGLDLATLMYWNATRGLHPSPRERAILERIVARYIKRAEGVSPPSIDRGEPTADRSEDGKAYIIVVPPGVESIQIRIGDGRSVDVDPIPDSPPPTDEPDEAPPPDGPAARRGGPGEKVL